MNGPWESNMHDLSVVDDGMRLLQMKSRVVGTTNEKSTKIGYDSYCEVNFYGFEERDADDLDATSAFNFMQALHHRNEKQPDCLSP